MTAMPAQRLRFNLPSAVHRAELWVPEKVTRTTTSSLML